ncbi:HAMP domain-containing sensor histidine kinase [Alloacidobacterium sp.]|uniref:sensor histidine kinase n=1 Tax=Alloacidobacterium sp. TaxID=2951999 RepID=UPI002D53C5D5|nr:HAMP domain-containing sensor histidine kinase [Alloacidobacterium sp.]HYK37751.1 HAMP domain-containing sensor histidine kinase [Alloacidobacterium sp.]
MKPYSIARRLIVTVLLVELVTAVCVTGMAWLYERHSHLRSFDILLRGRADSLLGSVQDAEDADDNIMLNKSDMDVPAEDVYEVRDEKGRLLGRSPNWDGAATELLGRHSDGYFNSIVNGRHYRSLLLHGLRVVDPGDKDGGVPRHVTIVYGAPTRRVWRAVTGAVKFYALASLVLLLVTGIVMAWLLHRGMAPLRALTAEAAGVSVNAWRFHPPEEARATKELAPLVDALESTLQRLEHSFFQQRRFVSDAAHELKTGVAVVKSSLQLLSIRQRSAAEYEAGLERCETDCGRMEEIVAKMLTLARVESTDSKQVAPLLSADVSAVLRKTAEMFSSMAELRGVDIAWSLPGPLYAALPADECALLFSNLFLNALQHSTRGTQISISAQAREDMVEAVIKDRGDGIPAEALPHIFERFYRGDPSRNRNTGGTGLGLSICKAIVDAAGGEIKIDSTVGVGTTVSVRLPAGVLRSVSVASAAPPLCVDQ